VKSKRDASRRDMGRRKEEYKESVLKGKEQVSVEVTSA